MASYGASIRHGSRSEQICFCFQGLPLVLEDRSSCLLVYFFIQCPPLSALFLASSPFWSKSCLCLSIFICLSIFLKSLKHQHTQLWNSLHKTQFNHSFACFFTNTCWTVILAYIIFNVLVIFLPCARVKAVRDKKSLLKMRHDEDKGRKT